MDSLFHFIFAIIGGLALNLHRKHKLELIVFIAFAAVLIDIDHFFGMVPRGTLHNLFFVIGFPFALFIAFYSYEKKKSSIRLQSAALLLMVMLFSHVIADTFSEGKVLFFYPLSQAGYGMLNLEIAFLENLHAGIINVEGIAAVVYFILLLAAIFIEDFIYFFEKQHMKLRAAFRKTEEDLL